ncbi:SDR family oxidoreductase [Actinomadura barringtoniae]|uniref:SDR family oxidoreductase n=1 Tax=Actinomadura barringtoniae TaxID=1427535 RepID=A0A939PMQ3_9ACTN|nr:SDR family oxidoreductase [Actinomadura barringtoniae]MBO2451396.1 SDR family oxidoreductase [Actinomadura barringtoniae]
MTTEHVVIVGGSSGMGLALAGAVLAEGADVTVASRSAERLEEAARSLGSSPRLRTVQADITREDDVARLFKEPVDHVVTTAVDATGAYGPVAELDLSTARGVVEAKLIGALAVAKYAAPVIRAGGSITFTSGVASERPARGGTVIAAANGGLDALVRGLAMDLAPIRVNAISPGWVDTPMWEAIAGDGKAAALAAKAEALPVGRVGRVEDIAQATLALMRNGYVTGTVLHADGGHRLV